MTNKPITSATVVSTIDSTDKIFVNSNNDLKQITVSELFNNVAVITDTEFDALWSEIINSL